MGSVLWPCKTQWCEGGVETLLRGSCWGRAWFCKMPNICISKGFTVLIFKGAAFVTFLSVALRMCNRHRDLDLLLDSALGCPGQRVIARKQPPPQHNCQDWSDFDLCTGISFLLLEYRVSLYECNNHDGEVNAWVITFMLWQNCVFLCSLAFLQMPDGVKTIGLDQTYGFLDYACLWNL